VSSRSPFARAKEPSEIRYVDRQSGEIRTEVVLGDGLVRMVYERALGRALRRAVLTRPVFSRAYGRYQSSRRSTRSIGKVVAELAIAMEDYVVPPDGFASFNDFFTRRLREGARPIDHAPGRLVSPADGRTFAYTNVRGDTLLPAKGRHISLSRLLGGAAAAEPFVDGTVVIVRLCPSDYHRFHFPCDGVASAARTLPGPLESVNPLALAKGRAILDHNQRDVTIVTSPDFGQVAYIEVGAMCVGRIEQRFSPGPVHAGDEKGLFEFGGSTVILVLQAGRVVIDPDLVANTEKGLETFLKMGEGIGTAPPRSGDSKS
jgi:phosphatidylserine decarboxylase